MHGNDSWEYKYYPKVLGLAVDVLQADKSFDLTTFLQLIGSAKPKSDTIADITDSTLVEQIRNDVLAEKWDSLKNCG